MLTLLWLGGIIDLNFHCCALQNVPQSKNVAVSLTSDVLYEQLYVRLWVESVVFDGE